MDNNICTVLVTNNDFFDRLIQTLKDILTYEYVGDICVVIGDDLVNSDKLNHPLLKLNNNIIIKYFPDIIFTEEFNKKFNSISRDDLWRRKKFQYHKLNLFNVFFKQWDYIFYMDVGMKVFCSIDPIIKARKPGKFLAHSDAYPDYTYDLSIQFANDDPLFEIISKKYNLHTDFPQTTIMLYDTSIINANTFDDLVNLAEECMISRTNDQGIIALYFTVIKKLWEQIQLENESNWFYDYNLRPNKTNKPHIMLKNV
jgi:hypothetical protein